jgi:predicted transcriptional regulator
MTELLELAMQSACQLPDERQDYVARELLRLLEGEQTPEPTDPAHIEAIRRGLAQIRRGEFAPDEEIEAVYRSFEE